MGGGQSPPLRTSNCQVLPTVYSHCPNDWTPPPFSTVYIKKTHTLEWDPTISVLESSIFKNSTPFPRNSIISFSSCSVCLCFFLEQRQSLSWFFPPSKSLCEVCCAVLLCGIPWLPAVRMSFLQCLQAEHVGNRGEKRQISCVIAADPVKASHTGMGLWIPWGRTPDWEGGSTKTP